MDYWETEVDGKIFNFNVVYGARGCLLKPTQAIQKSTKNSEWKASYFY